MTTTLTTSIDEARDALRVLQRHLHRLAVSNPQDDNLKGMALYHAGMVEEALEDIEMETLHVLSWDIASQSQRAISTNTKGLTMTDEKETLLMTLPEAGDQLRVCAKTVERMIARGELRAVRIGRAVRVARTELERYIHDQTTGEPAS